jgi:hypothetical protein
VLPGGDGWVLRACLLPPLRRVRVRVEIMGSHTCRLVGKSQPVMLAGVYGEADGFSKPGRAYPYTTLLMSLSQMWALYCLVHFYHATHTVLRHISPLRKFLSIKIIVFFTCECVAHRAWAAVSVEL